MSKNKPYVKEYKNGLLVNPITKDKPYLHKYLTTIQQKELLKTK